MSTSTSPQLSPPTPPRNIAVASGNAPRASALWHAIVTCGFAAALAVWTAWYFTHLPMLAWPESTALPTIVVVWSMALALSGWSVGKPHGWKVGVGAGVLSALLGLLVLGSKITTQSASAQTAMEPAKLVPNAGLIVLGFIFLGAVLGAVSGTLGAVVAGASRLHSLDERTWFGRFTLVVLASFAPLVFAGGLVTSTNAGMAVPDWPNSFGSNMFLYPLGPRAAAADGADARRIFSEHSHRLFGALAGIHALALLVWACARPVGKPVRAWTIGMFLFIAAQGVLGGKRVHLDSRVLAIIHGVSAQLIVLLAAVIAAKASIAATPPTALGSFEGSRRFRSLATAALHTAILQLILGALYRHLRSTHVLYTHIAVSFAVMAFASMDASLAAAAGSHESMHGSRRAGRTLKMLGKALMIVSGLQFLLGWAAFLGGGKGIEATGNLQALLRTAHQTNGALMFALLAAVYVFARTIKPTPRA